MPRRATPLTAAGVRTAKPGRWHDGDGLCLLVRDNGTAFWIFRYRVPRDPSSDGEAAKPRMRELGLGRARGSKNVVTLAEARNLAAPLYRLVHNGIDPLEQREAEAEAAKAAAQVEKARAITFKTAATRYIEAHEAAWRNAVHARQWRVTLVTYAYAHFGDLPTAKVGTAEVLAALEPIWTKKPETASRLRGRIEAVLDYAKTREWRSGENPARWKGHLDKLLAPRAKVARVEHHAALPWQQINSFITDLRQQPGVAALALQFAILTAARTGEVIGATWGEIDLQGALWTVPAERMKASREHRVPLSAPAVAALETVAKLRLTTDPQEPVFPGAKAGKPMSNMAMLVLLRRMQRGDLTAHGFRSTFRDWCAETGRPHDIAEAALAHTIGDKTVAAYQRGDMLERRRKLMDDWAVFVEKPAGDVVTLKAIEAAA